MEHSQETSKQNQPAARRASAETTRPDAGGRQRGGRRAVIRVFAALALLAVIAGGVMVALAVMLAQAPSDRLPESFVFTVEPGETLAGVADRLEQLGVIRSALVVRGIARLSGTETRIQSGSYRISRSMSAEEVIEFLTSGSQILVQVTIPEGLTATRVAERLEAAGITSADAFVEAVSNAELSRSLGVPAAGSEGFLFPDTYSFTAGQPAEDVVAHMVSRFFEVARSVAPDGGLPSGDALYQTVILASIVEREYRVPEEAPTIAGVFYNRLEEQMRLESCATVVYVMTEEEDLPHPQRLFYRDLERESPYNTYRNPGLPPGPIANPGRTALDAAFNPSDTDYLFFVWYGPGSDGHHFSRSLAEHNEASLLYLKTP